MNQANPFSNFPIRASDFLGTKVVDQKNESLGDIKELVLDPAGGRIAYVVVAFGGFLGMGEKLFAIPFGAFKFNAAERECVLNIPKEKLKEAPGFDKAQWPTMADEKWNRDVHSYYHLSPFWE